MRRADLFGQLGTAGPEQRVGVGSGDRRDRRAPRTGSDHRDGGHDPTVVVVRAVQYVERVSTAHVAVLIPVKSFAASKHRLADAIEPVARAEMVRSMAETVLAAAGSLRAAVVCDDEEVAAWARRVGADVVWAPGHGLNGAVEAGVDALGAGGARQVIVAHADLPLAVDLAWVADFDGVTLVPDRRLDGTNVICIPAAGGFRFAYGPGSFVRHRAEADRVGAGVRLVRDPSLAWDVDVPADLDFAPAGD